MRTHLLLTAAAVALLGASSAFAGNNTVYLDQYDNSLRQLVRSAELWRLRFQRSDDQPVR